MTKEQADLRAIAAVDNALVELGTKRQDGEIGSREFAAGVTLILPAKISALVRMGRDAEAQLIREWLEDVQLTQAADQNRKWLS